MLDRTRLMALVLACLTSGGAAAGASKVTWQTDLKQAVYDAGRVKKPLLVEFTASWCGYCRKMSQTTFADERIVRHVNGCFVPVSLDADENRALMQTVGVEALPTTVILSPELKLVKKIIGFQTADQLEEQLGTICRNDGDVEFAAASGAAADPPAREADAAVSAGDAVAFDRVCLVSLRDEQRVRTGRREYAADFRGRRVWFASAEHLRRFEENPRHYWPVLDGRCAVSAVDDGVRRTGTPQFALEYRDRVWLFADRERQERFFDKAPDYTARLVALLERSAQPEPPPATHPEGRTPTGQPISERR